MIERKRYTKKTEGSPEERHNFLLISLISLFNKLSLTTKVPSYLSCILNWLFFFFLPLLIFPIVQIFMLSVSNTGLEMALACLLLKGFPQETKNIFTWKFTRVEEIGERDNEPRTMNEFLNFHHVRWQRTKQRSRCDGLATIGLMKWTSAFFTFCGWWCGVYFSPSFLWWELYSFIQKMHSDAGKQTFDK